MSPRARDILTRRSSTRRRVEAQVGLSDPPSPDTAWAEAYEAEFRRRIRADDAPSVPLVLSSHGLATLAAQMCANDLSRAGADYARCRMISTAIAVMLINQDPRRPFESTMALERAVANEFARLGESADPVRLREVMTRMITAGMADPQFSVLIAHDDGVSVGPGASQLVQHGLSLDPARRFDLRASSRPQAG